MIMNIKIINIFFRFLISTFFIFIIIKSKYIKLKKLNKEEQYKYFFCFTSMAKSENKYVHELINYYKNIGVNKFYLADNNDNTSKKYKIYYKMIY